MGPMGGGGVVSSMNNEKPNSEEMDAFTSSPGLQLVYETAPVGLAFLSTDCRYLMINQHLTEICGLSIADHIGRSVRETVPQVADQVEQIVQRIARSGAPIVGVEVNGQRPDGSNVDRVWITYWHPLKDKNSNVIGINVAAEEVTDRKRAEAERATMHDRLRRLNDTLAERVEAEAQERDRLWRLSQDLLVVTDTELGTIRNVNPAWTAVLGWSADDLVGKTGDWLIHPDDRERSREELVRLQNREPSPYFENRIQCKDGSYRWLSWRAMLDRTSVYAIARDITKLKQTEDQLYTLRSELARVSRQTTLGAMTASITHEIGQPLTSIAANANAGLRWLDAPEPRLAEVRTALSRVVRDIRRVDEVIASIRKTLGKTTGETRPVNLRALIREVLVLTQHELESKQILLRNDISADLPAVAGDRVQLQQVLVNLIINAIEAMSEVSERERLLTIDSSLHGSIIIINIADVGSGIEAAKISQIFEPFFTTKAEGMGLGLFISRSIVEAHGGELSISPNMPHGTIFHLTLPTLGAAENG
jgi:PAS domain S-box-containing protein